MYLRFLALLKDCVIDRDYCIIMICVDMWSSFRVLSLSRAALTVVPEEGRLIHVSQVRIIYLLFLA